MTVNLKKNCDYIAAVTAAARNKAETLKKKSFLHCMEKTITLQQGKAFSEASRAYGLAEIKTKTLNTLKEILHYNKRIREPQVFAKISLERAPVLKCDIPYQPNYFYRIIGDGGYDDMVKTGIVRAKQNAKHQYQAAYFQEGKANTRYRGGSSYILEVAPTDRMIITEKTYPYLTNETSTNEIRYRIWHNYESNKYETVVDTINDIITKNPDFRIM